MASHRVTTPDSTPRLPRRCSRPRAQARRRVASPFLLRTADPPVADLVGRAIRDVRRLGKRIVLALEDDYFVVLHLMIAGRLHWKPAGAPIPRRAGLAAFDFPNGTLLLTEAGTKHRASLHILRGAAASPHTTP